MNIFFLDESPRLAARMQVDKHVVKMILESAQLLSTNIRIVHGDEIGDLLGLYKKTHVNHPCTIWVRCDQANYNWLFEHFESLCDEYTYRFEKIHKSKALIDSLRKFVNSNVSSKTHTVPALCMPDVYKSEDYVKSYREYYSVEKKHLHKWTKRTFNNGEVK